MRIFWFFFFLICCLLAFFISALWGKQQDRFLLSFALGNTSITGNGSGSCGASQPNNAYFQPAGDQNVQPSLLETIDSNLPKRETGMATTGAVEISEVLHKNSLQSQDSLTRWMNIIENDSPGSLDDLPMECPISTVSGSGETMVMGQSPLQEAFSITEVSPAWAFSTEETKVYPCHSDFISVQCCVIYSYKQYPLSYLLLGLPFTSKSIKLFTLVF